MKVLKLLVFALTVTVLFLANTRMSIAKSTEDLTYQKPSSQYNKGLKLEEAQNFKAAFETFSKIAEKKGKRSAELLYHIGYCQLYLTKAREAIKSLVAADSLISNENKTSDLSIDLLLILGKSYQLVLRTEDAIKVYQKLLTFVEESDTELIQEINHEIASCKNAQIFLENPVEISIT